MKQYEYIEVEQQDLCRLLFAIGYTQQELRMEDTDHSGFLDPNEFERLGHELSEDWHHE